MFLHSWVPKVGARKITDNLWVEPSLHFTARLDCPCCGNRDTVETSGHLLGNVPLSMNIDWEIGQLAAQRDCSKCGTVSVMPAPDKKRLGREATEQVTPEWIESQKARYTFPPQRVTSGC